MRNVRRLSQTLKCVGIAVKVYALAAVKKNGFSAKAVRKKGILMIISVKTILAAAIALTAANVIEMAYMIFLGKDEHDGRLCAFDSLWKMSGGILNVFKDLVNRLEDNSADTFLLISNTKPSEDMLCCGWVDHT